MVGASAPTEICQQVQRTRPEDSGLIMRMAILGPRNLISKNLHQLPHDTSHCALDPII